jgi:hypothetical protein
MLDAPIPCRIVKQAPVRVPSLTKPERLLAPADGSAIRYLSADCATRRVMLSEARKVWAQFRESHGFKRDARPLLTPPTAQAKLAKSAVPTFGLSLVPGAASGFNLCPAASRGCLGACLHTSGKGRLGSVRFARWVRAQFALTHPAEFGIILVGELIRHATVKGAIRVRLNVVSDVRWAHVMPETLSALKALGVVAYDYTKYSPRLYARNDLVHLTRSASERMSDADIIELVNSGENVAVVFAASKRVVKRACADGLTWHGIRLVDGLSTDDRTLDPTGCIVALAALGDGVGDSSGFVRPWAPDTATLPMI